MISLVFAQCISADISMVLKLMEHKQPHRYYDGIIRNMCEQVLEYLNLCDNPNNIKEFLGIDKDDSEIEAIGEMNVFAGIRKLIGDKRYSSTHNISNIANLLGEHDGTDEKLSLYEVYQYESTLYHNAYLMEYYDMVSIFAGSEKKDEVSGEMGVQYIMLVTILSSFMDKYEEVMGISSEGI